MRKKNNFFVQEWFLRLTTRPYFGACYRQNFLKIFRGPYPTPQGSIPTFCFISILSFIGSSSCVPLTHCTFAFWLPSTHFLFFFLTLFFNLNSYVTLSSSSNPPSLLDLYICRYLVKEPL